MTAPPAPGAKRVLSDLIEVPEEIHDGDFVFKLAAGVEEGQSEAIAQYVITDQLAECFSEALDAVKGSLAQNQSRATYLNGSFGSGKSHFMAVFNAILRQNPAVRDIPRMPALLDRHENWLNGKRFIQVKSHLVDAESIESAILGGYVRQVRAEYPDAPVPPVYRADGLLADARNLRATLGDDAFIAGLPALSDDGSGDEQQWGQWATSRTWTPELLDQAFAVPSGTDDKDAARLRLQLVSALLHHHFTRYADTVHGSAEAFVTMDEGLSIISRHAKDELGCDAVILLLDELILRFTRFIGKESVINEEVQRVAKLVESSESHRPAPVISFVPRQRDLRELVGLGAGTAGVDQTLKYWDGRFGHIKLADGNLTEVVRHRLLRPKNDSAAAEIATAFENTRNASPEVKDALLDTEGGDADSWEDFRALYPFTPALLHVMVDLSGALQRQRSALKLMRQLMVNHRDSLPVGQLVPLGALFDVLDDGEDRPFKDVLSAEYTKISSFYRQKVRPWLLHRHDLRDADAANLDVRAPFRAEDLLVKTLLLSGLAPNVPALKDLTASRLIGLNHGIVRARRTGQDIERVADFFRDLNGQFGEIRVGNQTTNPTVSLNLLRVDTESLMRQVYSAANDHALNQLFKRLLWQELALDAGATRTEVVWRGTRRVVELDYGNVRSEDRLHRERFVPDTAGALRVVVDYPFDEEDKHPSDDRERIERLREEFSEPPATVAWLPNFLSPARLEDARRLLMVENLLQPGVIEQKAPDWSSEDRREAAAQLDNQRAQLETQLRGLMRGAYGLVEPNETDYTSFIDSHIHAFPPAASISLEAGSQFPAALERVCGKLLTHMHPEHPDLSSGGSSRTPVRRQDLSAVLEAVEAAQADRLQRYEPPKTALPVLRRVAHELRIAQVSEVFVLRDDWMTALDKAARSAQADTTEIRVRHLKEWIRDTAEGSGLPDDVVDLLVLVYAIQSDRAWMRGGKRYTAVGIGQLEGDIVLKRQELPSAGDFERANERANGIFKLPKQPVRNARAVQRLAEQLKEQANRWQAATESLLTELRKRAALLGLDEDAPRIATAKATHDLLKRMRGLADDTELVTALARAELSQEPKVYRDSMDSASAVAQALAAAQWQNIEALAERAEQGGEHAEEAAQLLEGLRQNARNNEQQRRIATELEKVGREAFSLLVRKPQPTGPGPKPPEPVDRPNGKQQVTLPETGEHTATRRLSAQDDPADVIRTLRQELGVDADAEIEITVRVIK
ncbi:phage resistance protein [Streptomonospora wellingtoniae]|uniref:Phage resistance protein n=1 Tax=Streptomonospora wellingtoniae TaxID=3075544 RepID=A0ABU2KYN0_9ACTN|nr:phage resistance protein [Streptomonospora sp. DSM 45055]MDT0304252.1 phage resistance protein [Streptomonospora sp. DSM 45055]